MSRRKQPDSSVTVRMLLTALFAPVGRAISRRPSIAGGSVAIVVAFSYIALNAVSQTQKHPSPLFVTREAPKEVTQFPDEAPVPDGRVTTFKIERSDPQSTASIPETPPQPTAIGNDTVFLVQQAMRERGLYSGIADGVTGPQTRTAIQLYQIEAGLEPDGEPSGSLLVHMTLRDLKSAPLPASRPAIPASSPEASPIWTRSRSLTTPQSAPREGRDIVVDIQRGLSNIAYADIEIDGIVGQQTRTAIADFQKHYRLPVTGEPDKAVLDKLREIGAL